LIVCLQAVLCTFVLFQIFSSSSFLLPCRFACTVLFQSFSSSSMFSLSLIVCKQFCTLVFVLEFLLFLPPCFGYDFLCANCFCFVFLFSSSMLQCLWLYK
jgi:hypothetical protein